MKISSSTIATLAIAATAVGGAAFGISKAVTVTEVTSPANTQVVNSASDSNKIANPDTPSGKIASIVADPSATPTPETPTVVPGFGSGSRDESDTTATPVNPNDPLVGSGDDSESDDDSLYNSSDANETGDDSNYGDDSESDD